MALTYAPLPRRYALPLYESWIILGGSISGYALVHEGADQPIGNIVGYWLSLCLLLIGLYVLIWWPPVFAQQLGDGDAEIPQVPLAACMQSPRISLYLRASPCISLYLLLHSLTSYFSVTVQRGR